MTDFFAVRRMTHWDVDRCVAVLREGYPDLDAGKWVARFEGDVADNGKYPVVAVVADVVVGYARTVSFEPDAGSPANVAPGGYYLLGLGVAADYRRRGIARLLTEERLRWLVGRGAEGVYYYTDRDNRGSHRLHEQLGFRQITDSFWFPALPREHTQVLYGLQLQGEASSDVDPSRRQR
jgi:ribosomal protein S18 acetylase RimI-like enzyme